MQTTKCEFWRASIHFQEKCRLDTPGLSTDRLHEGEARPQGAIRTDWLQDEGFGKNKSPKEARIAPYNALLG